MVGGGKRHLMKSSQTLNSNYVLWTYMNSFCIFTSLWFLGKNSRIYVVLRLFLFHELHNPPFSSPCQQKLCEWRVAREPCRVERVKVERRRAAPNRTPQPFLAPNVINFSLRALQQDFKLLLFSFII